MKEFRDAGYAGAADTSRSLLNWWFNTPHLLEQSDGTMAEFQYYFAQREALETVIYLYDVAGVKDKFDLMRFDSSEAVSAGMFDETWRRFVVKMATGSGKTKVMGLVIAWSFFHKLYEPDSGLSRNFLVVHNIIVLDRIYHDFKGLRVFESSVAGQWFRRPQLARRFPAYPPQTGRSTGYQAFGKHLPHQHTVMPETYIHQQMTRPSGYFLGKRLADYHRFKVDLGMIVRDVDERWF